MERRSWQRTVFRQLPPPLFVPIDLLVLLLITLPPIIARQSRSDSTRWPTHSSQGHDGGLCASLLATASSLVDSDNILLRKLQRRGLELLDVRVTVASVSCRNFFLPGAWRGLDCPSIDAHKGKGLLTGGTQRFHT